MPPGYLFPPSLNNGKNRITHQSLQQAESTGRELSDLEQVLGLAHILSCDISIVFGNFHGPMSFYDLRLATQPRICFKQGQGDDAAG